MILGLVALGRRLRHSSSSAQVESSVALPDQLAALQLALGIVAIARRFEPPADLPPPALAAASGPSLQGNLLL